MSKSNKNTENTETIKALALINITINSQLVECGSVVAGAASVLSPYVGGSLDDSEAAVSAAVDRGQSVIELTK